MKSLLHAHQFIMTLVDIMIHIIPIKYERILQYNVVIKKAILLLPVEFLKFTGIKIIHKFMIILNPFALH